MHPSVIRDGYFGTTIAACSPIGPYRGELNLNEDIADTINRDEATIREDGPPNLFEPHASRTAPTDCRRRRFMTQS